MSCTQFKTVEQCSIDEQNAFKSQLNKYYEEWKASLDYMDQEVVEKAYIKMDSLVIAFPTCAHLPVEFLPFADSVSSLYTKDKIRDVTLLVANHLILQLDTMVLKPTD
jgi:hypothetical protein